MEAEEISALVDELDLRVERLRVLYDQYFMGIEKIPPEVLKKDVERRMWVLRREKIRNTGTRFRFQQITQRLNTFQSYWMRICREIENGTYKRDVMRAKKRFGNAPTAVAVATRDKPESAPPFELDDVDIELEEPTSERAPHTERRNVMDELDEEFPPLFPDTARMSVAPKASPLPPAPPQKPAPAPPRIAPVPPRPPTNTGTANAPMARIAPAAAPAPAVKSAVAPSPVAARAPLGARIPAGGAPVEPAPRESDPRHPFAARGSVAKMAISARPVKNNDDLDAMLDEALGGTTKPAAKPEPKAAPRPEPKPEPKPPANPAPRFTPAARPTPVARPSGAQAPVDGDRQVYARYVEMKRKNGESTAGLTYESLQRSIEATRTKLKERSGGKAIDFDVVVKDGKTILKPVVK